MIGDNAGITEDAFACFSGGKKPKDLWSTYERLQSLIRRRRRMRFADKEIKKKILKSSRQ